MTEQHGLAVASIDEFLRYNEADAGKIFNIIGRHFLYVLMVLTSAAGET